MFGSVETGVHRDQTGAHRLEVSLFQGGANVIDINHVSLECSHIAVNVVVIARHHGSDSKKASLLSHLLLPRISCIPVVLIILRQQFPLLAMRFK